MYKKDPVIYFNFYSSTAKEITVKGFLNGCEAKASKFYLFVDYTEYESKNTS